MGQRVDRQPTQPFGCVVTKALGSECMPELVKRKRDDQCHQQKDENGYLAAEE